MVKKDHGAVGPALGYYYQAIYALIQLFKSKSNDAFVSIETLDDVYHEDGGLKTLIQLKHSIQENTKLSIKSKDLWKTIKVWCDHIEINNAYDGIFTLSTVSSINKSSSLNLLKSTGNDRSRLVNDLNVEAKRVMSEREESDNGKKPFESRYKGCEAFLKLSKRQQSDLLNNVHLVTDSFTISQAKSEVVNFLSKTVQFENQEKLAEIVLEWWDRQAVKSLTKERSESIYLSELVEFVSRKNAELYNDGFTNDLLDMDIPEAIEAKPVQKQQLDLIDATSMQRRRSINTEIKARIQREIWMRKSMPAIKKLEQYDKLLEREWSYEFEDIRDECCGQNEVFKKTKGRVLLDWSHKKSHNQVSPISENYTDKDLIRGSFQILSISKKVGWHPDFKDLIKLKNDE